MKLFVRKIIIDISYEDDDGDDQGGDDRSSLTNLINMKENITSEEQENFWKSSSTAEISSKK